MIFNEVELAQKNGEGAVISVGDWIKYALLNLLNVIPIIGSIALLVIFILMAVKDDTAKSMRNAIIAGFILAGICLALSILLFIFAAAVGIAIPWGLSS